MFYEKEFLFIITLKKNSTKAITRKMMINSIDKSMTPPRIQKTYTNSSITPTMGKYTQLLGSKEVDYGSKEVLCLKLAEISRFFTIVSLMN